MRTLLVACCLLSMHVCAQAQEIKLLTFNTDTSVVLRWIGNTNPAITSWNVERSVDGALFVQINEAPLVREMSFSNAADRVGSARAEMYLMLFGVDQTRDLKTSDISETITSRNAGFHFALLAAQPELSDLTGERFVDVKIPETAHTVRYRIIGNGAGGEILRKETDMLVRASADRVPVPDTVIVEGLDNSVRLRWPRDKKQSDRGDVVGFRVYKALSESGPFEEITTMNAITFFGSEEDEKFYSWTDDLIDNGATAFYYIRQMHGTGVLGDRSEIVLATSGSDTSPLPPSNFSAAEFGVGIQLTWKWAEDPTRLTRVQVIRRISDRNSQWSSHDINKTDTAYLDALVDVGVAYRYALLVTRAKTTISSDTLETFIADAAAPDAPPNLRALSDTGRIVLLWNRSASKDVVGYHVYRSSDEKRRTRLQLTNNLIKDTVYTDVLARDAEGWHGYFVTAEDRTGNTSEPSPVVVTRTTDVTPPSAPQITLFEQKDSVVSITWTRSHATDVARYIIELSDSSMRWRPIETTANDNITFTLKGIGRFLIHVIAEDSSNNRSKPSVERTAFVELKVHAPDKLSIIKQDVDIKLTWTAVKGADGYRIVRVDPRTGARTTCATLTAKETSWLDKFSQRDRTWIYRVAARNSSWEYGPETEQTYSPPKE